MKDKKVEKRMEYEEEDLDWEDTGLEKWSEKR